MQLLMEQRLHGSAYSKAAVFLKPYQHVYFPDTAWIIVPTGKLISKLPESFGERKQQMEILLEMINRDTGNVNI